MKYSLIVCKIFVFLLLNTPINWRYTNTVTIKLMGIQIRAVISSHWPRLLIIVARLP